VPISKFDAKKQAMFQNTWEVQERNCDERGCLLIVGLAIAEVSSFTSLIYFSKDASLTASVSRG